METPENRSLLTRGVEEVSVWERSPFIQGFLAGVKGAIVGASAGALTNVIRGKSAPMGALVGGIGAGLLTGVGKAAIQKVDNVNQEAAIRYHTKRLLDREPMVFMPPPRVAGPLFARAHDVY